VGTWGASSSAIMNNAAISANAEMSLQNVTFNTDAEVELLN
jgi:hypothetical protein